MDWLQALFLGTFSFGALATVASAALGFGHLGFGHHSMHLPGFHAGHGVHPGLFNLTAVFAFLAWFGGVGYLALTGWELAAGFAFGVAVLAGVFGYAVIYLFFVRVLLPADRSMDPADYQYVGTVAQVTAPIRAGRTGEIRYVKGGVRHSEGARSADGAELLRGTEVVIARYERGIAYVQTWEAFVREDVGASTLAEGG